MNLINYCFQTRTKHAQYVTKNIMMTAKQPFFILFGLYSIIYHVSFGFRGVDNIWEHNKLLSLFRTFQCPFGAQITYEKGKMCVQSKKLVVWPSYLNFWSIFKILENPRFSNVQAARFIFNHLIELISIIGVVETD